MQITLFSVTPCQDVASGWLRPLATQYGDQRGSLATNQCRTSGRGQSSTLVDHFLTTKHFKALELRRQRSG